MLSNMGFAGYGLCFPLFLKGRGKRTKGVFLSRIRVLDVFVFVFGVFELLRYL